MTEPHSHAPTPGRCAEHGGLMWSNAMRACITPDDVIRGGCRWSPLDGPDFADLFREETRRARH